MAEEALSKTDIVDLIISERDEHTWGIQNHVKIIGFTSTANGICPVRELLPCEHYIFDGEQYSAELFIQLMKRIGVNFELRKGKMCWGEPING